MVITYQNNCQLSVAVREYLDSLFVCLRKWITNNFSSIIYKIIYNNIMLSLDCSYFTYHLHYCLPFGWYQIAYRLCCEGKHPNWLYIYLWSILYLCILYEPAFYQGKKCRISLIWTSWLTSRSFFVKSKCRVYLKLQTILFFL